MSTKIYYAQRVPISMVSEHAQDIREQTLNLVSQEIKKMTKYSQDNEFLKQFYYIYCKDNDFLLKKGYKNFIKERMNLIKFFSYIRYTWNNHNGFYDPNNSINYFFDKKYAYAAFCGSVSSKLTIPDYAVDYCYWNNTDQPEDISRRSWESRGKKWDQVAFDNMCYEFNRFMYQIIHIEKKSHSTIGLIELAKVCYPKIDTGHFYAYDQYFETLDKVLGKEN